MARLPAQRVCASIIKLSPVSSQLRRCGVVASAPGGTPAGRGFESRARPFFRSGYLFVQFAGNFRTSPRKTRERKKSPSQWRFSCEKMGIYVITYKAKGFSAKNMPRRHLTDGPQRSDTLSIRINTRFSLICKNLDECWY